MTTFAIATIDELWLRGELAERRLSYGRAEQRADEIFAIDARDDELVERCERLIEQMRAVMPADADRVRLVARDTGTMTVTINGLSLVTTPDFVADDANLLRSMKHATVDDPSLPIVWRNGSASVLLHEAIGHPMELDMPPVAWPEWLATFCPMAMRRASFSDVPLRRMIVFVAAQFDAPFELPEPRIDVELIRGGAYDPLTDVVTIDVAVPRFTIRATRAQIAASIVGASGEPVRYPGVVCSREGQELVVGSFAPLLVTRGLA